MATATKFLPQVIRMADDDRSPDGWMTEDDGTRHPVFNTKGRGKKSRGKRRKGRREASRLSLMIRMAEEDEPVAADVIPEPEEEYDSIDEILDMLEEFNIRLPDDTTDENLIERLRTALHTAMAHKEDEEGEGEGEEGMPEMPEAEEAPPVEETPQALSLASAKAVTEQYRRSLRSRLRKLANTGRCTVAEVTDTQRALGSTSISLAPLGQPCHTDADTWVAPDANVIGRVTLDEGASVWFGATIRGDHDDIVIGAGSNIQENTVMHIDRGYPLTIGKNCTIGHKVMLHGCTIGDNTRCFNNIGHTGQRQRLQIGGVGHGYILTRHPSHRRIQIIKTALHDASRDLGSNTRKTPPFLHHQRTVGLGHTGENRRLIERLDGAWINDLCLNAKCCQLLGRLQGKTRHPRMGNNGDIIPLPFDVRLAQWNQ